MKEVTEMAVAAALSLITLLQGLFSGCGTKQEEPVSGGVSDYSDKNAAKTIESDDLRSFEYDFNYYGDEFARGHYLLKIELAAAETADDGEEITDGEPYGAGGAAYSVSIDTAEPLELSGTADASVMRDLAALIKENNTAALNGWNKYNSALGSDMSFEAVYGSGEKISILARGGVSAAPDLDPTPYIRFFDELAQRDGGSVFAYSFEDDSDPDAPKKIMSDTLTEFHIKVYNDTSRNGDGFMNGFYWGNWYISYNRKYKTYADHDENCCVQTKTGNYFFDLSDEAADRLGHLLKDMGLEKLNGYDVTDKNGGYEYNLSAYYGEETLRVEVSGRRAVPEAFDYEKILAFFRDYCRESGVDVPPLEGRE